MLLELVIKKKKGEMAAAWSWDGEHAAGTYEPGSIRKNSHNGIIIASNVLSALGPMLFSVKCL